MVDVTLAYLLPKVVNVIHDEQIVVETYDLGKVMEELVREEGRLLAFPRVESMR